MIANICSINNNLYVQVIIYGYILLQIKPLKSLKIPNIKAHIMNIMCIYRESMRNALVFEVNNNLENIEDD